MRKNAGYVQSRLRVGGVYQPMVLLPNVVMRVALIAAQQGDEAADYHAQTLDAFVTDALNARVANLYSAYSKAVVSAE